MTTYAGNENVAMRKAAVICSMISSLRSGEDRKYHVGLVKYYIEGVSYSASGLSVDLATTPDICQTDAGFTCTATFPPEIIQPDIVRAKGIEKFNVGEQVREVVHVRLGLKRAAALRRRKIIFKNAKAEDVPIDASATHPSCTSS